MTRFFPSIAVALAMVLAATAQTSSQTQTPPVNSTTSPNQVGSGAQTKAGTPSQSSETPATGQVNPTGTAQTPAIPSPNAPATGGVAGAASSSATQAASPDAGPSGVAAVTDSDLQGQIQNALSKEPTLTGDTTHVAVSGDSIDLSGNVSNSKEKITATRIVQSFAGSKKVVNHLTIGGKSASPAAAPENRDNNRPASTNNPTTNPEPNKGAQPPLN